MKEPVDHILRPRLPWRRGEASITECGLDASKISTLTRAEFFKRLKDFGAQRTMMLTCVTCDNTARRWGTWEDDPRVGMLREIEWERGSSYFRARSDRGQRLRDELLVIATIIETHGAEFVAMVDEIEQRRAWNEKKAAHEKKPAPKIGGL